MQPKDPLRYLSGYPQSLQQQSKQLLDEGRLGDWLRSRYPLPHDIRGNQALYDYAMSLKNRYLKQTPPVSKVVYDDKISVLQHALGTHTRISRVQGRRLKAKKEIRVDARFREMPEAFLRMILVHELAHLRETDHNKAFYQLCCYMLPDYHQLELDLRLYLLHLEALGSVY